MKTLSTLTLATMAGAVAAFAQTSGPPEGFTQIFNAEDLTGWYGNNPHNLVKFEGAEKFPAIIAAQEEFKTHWTVENGELVNDGHGPYATTNKIYGDVEFHIDYKTVAKADSGIYMRGTPQIQIWDSTDEAKWKNGANLGSGGIWNNTEGNPGKNPLELADRTLGEWNSFRVRMLGARTWVWLNDKLVVDGAVWENYWDKTRSTPLPAKGPIHLQTHGGEIRWRNIFIREIGAEEANQMLSELGGQEGFNSVFNGKDLSGWKGATENYEVVKGAIRCKEGQGGILFTDEKYEDFVVRLEFKLPKGGNNGLAIRYPGEGNAAYDAMTELQVLDNSDTEKYAKLDPRQFHGSAYGMAPAHVGFLRPVGQWNFQEVTVKGSNIKVELNGTVILDTDLATAKNFMGNTPHPGKDLKSGHFGFAGHKDPVMFRNIEIRKL